MRSYDWANHITYLDDDTSVCLNPERLGRSLVKTPMYFDKPTCPNCSSLLNESLRDDNTQNPIEDESTDGLYVLTHAIVFAYAIVMALLVLNILS